MITYATREVSEESIGVTSCFTPDGLTWASVAQGLRDFDRRSVDYTIIYYILA